MPASRRRRAITLTPRSWPSSPTFASSTRIGWVTLEDRRLHVCSELCAKCLDALAARGTGTDRLDRCRHAVGVRVANHLDQIVERPGEASRVARSPVQTQRLDFSLPRLGIHPMQLERQVAGRLAVGVHADDDTLTCLLGQLEIVRRVRDLLLQPAGLDTRGGAAALIDLVEVLLRLPLD